MKILRKLSFTILFLVFTLPAATYAALTGWDYKTDTVITNSGSALTNYQVLITLDTQTLISAGKTQDDGDGIYFLNSNDSAQIFSQENVARRDRNA